MDRSELRLLRFAARSEFTDVLLEWLQREVTGVMLHTEDGDWCVHIGDDRTGFRHKNMNVALYIACKEVFKLRRYAAHSASVN